MQDLNNPQLEVGDLVRIECPRTRWDNRQGRLHELREESGQRSCGFVLLDGIAVRFPLMSLRRVEHSAGIGMQLQTSATGQAAPSLSFPEPITRRVLP
jgi:hypothetical protein